MSTTRATVQRVTLCVADIQRSLLFYSAVLGMNLVRRADGHTFSTACVSWPEDCGGGCQLELRQYHARGAVAALHPDTKKDAFVWLGLTNIPDVNATVKSLESAGVRGVNLQGQFEDIGYVAHFLDPDGFKLELLQTVMEWTFKQQACKCELPETPLRASDPCLGHVKFNVREVHACLRFYVDGLGMRLLSEQEVPRYGLTLFFLGFTHASDDAAPDSDVCSPHNREWMWQRRHTHVELQHW
jgi:catechol 2,3-dioxygenase-like lactoylglutathione lyase family enzyme